MSAELETASPGASVVAAARDVYRVWNPPWRGPDQPESLLDGDAQHLLARERAWRSLGSALAKAGLLP